MLDSRFNPAKYIQVQLTRLDAALLADALDLLSTALDGTGLEGLGVVGVATLGEGTSTDAGVVVTGDDLALHLLLIALLTGVSGSKAGQSGHGHLGESNHLERVKWVSWLLRSDCER